ncbi:ChaN family lipoprotein [Hoeflea sp. AS60]|uniref:ChaN family lipoprotein n=1 Tax=Hoeflea sp. AS60 TaxID=3135780 RepID=UPI00317CD083
MPSRLAYHREDKSVLPRLLFLVPFIAALMVIGLTSYAPAVAADSDEAWQAWTTDDYAPNELIGGIWSSKEQAFVSPSKLLEAVGGARFILLGENHDNAVHHHLQGWIIRNARLSGHLSVVMEQIDVSKTQALETFLAQSDPDPMKLGEALDWPNSGWPDWELYLPVARAALDRRADILPGLPATEQTRQIAKNGLSILQPARLSELQLDQPLPVAEAQALRQEIVEAHCDLLPTKAIPAMESVQRFRDAYMAEAMLKAGTKGPAVLISGNGHVNKARGVPWYLDQAGADGVIVIALTETIPEARTASNTPANDDVADYFWFTTHVDRGDPCAMLIDAPVTSE